jgi:hypothetical protein
MRSTKNVMSFGVVIVIVIIGEPLTSLTGFFCLAQTSPMHVWNLPMRDARSCQPRG